MPDKTTKVISKQWLNLAMLVVAILLVISVIVYCIAEHTDKPFSTKSEKGKFTSALTHVDAETVILEKTQRQLHDTNKKTDSLQQQVDSMKNTQHLDELADRVARLAKVMTEKQSGAGEKDPNEVPFVTGARDYQRDDMQATSHANALQAMNADRDAVRGIREDSLTLSPSASE